MRRAMMKTLGAALLLGALWLTAARADVKSCLQAAKNTYAGCKTGCKNAFLDDRANCKNIEPGCLSACLDARATCQSQCGCGGSGNPCGFNPCYVHCLDPYEQLRFSCKDACRNQWQLSGGPAAETACRTQFHACVAACPPAS